MTDPERDPELLGDLVEDAEQQAEWGDDDSDEPLVPDEERVEEFEDLSDEGPAV